MTTSAPTSAPIIDKQSFIEYDRQLKELAADPLARMNLVINTIRKTLEHNKEVVKTACMHTGLIIE